MLDVFSPSNYPLTNPEIMQATLKQGGLNLLRGYQNFLEDLNCKRDAMPPQGVEAFKVARARESD